MTMIRIFCIVVLFLTMFGVTLWAVDDDDNGGDA